MKLLLPWIVFSLVCNTMQPAPAADLPADGKLVVGEAYHLLKIEAIHDLNDVVLTDGKQKLRVTLASVLPFADWPPGEGYDKLKAAFLKELVAGLVGKEVSLDVLEVDRQGMAQGDISICHGNGFATEQWGGQNRIAEAYGWGITNINLLLIERGYSPYVKRAYFRGRKAHVAELFEQAQSRAIAKPVGYRAGKNAGEGIERVAAQQANEINVLLQGLKWPQALAVSRQLLTMDDAMIRRSVINGMSRPGDGNVKWQEVLVEHYFDEQEPFIRLNILDQLYGAELSPQRLQTFLEKVLQTETEEKFHHAAEAALKRLIAQ